MNLRKYQDNGGRRLPGNRRFQALLGPVLEKRRVMDRRRGFDRRKIRDSAVRIVGDERRKSLRDLSTL